MGWHVTPSLHIGLIDGDPDYRFTEISGLWRRRDGSILVADGQTSQIRIYGPDGVMMERFGRREEGPGEFRYLSFASAHRGDSVLATDARRVSIFDSRENLGRCWTIAYPHFSPSGREPAGYYSARVGSAEFLRTAAW